ncbi:general substrate transporter [Dactylonectria estremocensis]|uniref:General substrate transporter n=1 Tax=Dactylonectria estremocensis TaxID=1079267 RepID=A0A9P9EMS1_9HYPO|nr:general substrate transporter [Dactylonectria estremocensis]
MTSSEVDKVQQFDHVESTDSVDKFVFSDEAAERGAAIQEEERNLTIAQSTRQFWKSILYSSVAFAAAMMFGYDSIVNGASLSMPSFFMYFGDVNETGFYLPSIWTSLWAAMSSLFQAVGAFSAGFLMDRFGRTWTGSALSALTIAGTAMQYVAKTRGLLLAGKMVNGLGIGAGMAIGITYASEVAPVKLRAPIQQGIVLFNVAMFAVALGVVRVFVPHIEESAFRTVFAIQWAVGGLATVVFLLVPESPNFLVQKQRFTAAKKSLAKIYGPETAGERLALLVKTTQEEQANAVIDSGSYLDCFKGTDLKRTLTIIFIYIASNIAGAAFLTQNILILITAGLEAIHVFDIGVGGFGLAIVIILATWALAGKFRRHNAFLFGCIINLIIMVIIGALYYAPGQGGLWASAVLMNLLISLQTSIIQGMGWPIAAEISSYRLRGKSLALGTISQAIMAWLTAFVVPYMFNVDSGNLGIRTGFVWAGTSVFLILGAWFLVPDTTNLTAEEIDHLYIDKVNPRHFQKAWQERRAAGEN